MPSPPPTDDPSSHSNAPESSDGVAFEPQRIAHAFVDARRACLPLSDYPGPFPPDLAAGYAIQEAAIELWRDAIVGWKVGLIAAPLATRLGTSRLAGPIFSSNLVRSPSDPVALRAIDGGFAAIEIELVVSVRTDAPPRQTQWSLEQARDFAGDWYIGAEFAASPYAGINDHGPATIVSDFGNNAGLILGARLDPSLAADPAKLQCEVTVNGLRVGAASPAALPGGPLEALRFLLGHLAERGRALRSGQLVSTGAITGVHRIRDGERASAEFLGHGRIDVRVEAARRAPP